MKNLRNVRKMAVIIPQVVNRVIESNPIRRLDASTAFKGYALEKFAVTSNMTNL